MDTPARPDDQMPPEWGNLSGSYHHSLREYRFITTIYKSPRTVVNRAVDERTGEQVILKCRSLAGDPQALEHLKREYRWLSEVEGEGAVRVRQYFEDRDWATLILEDTGGRPLLEKVPVRNAETFLRLALPMCMALEQLHAKGIRHGDLNLDHFLWHETTRTVLLIDLDCAAFVTENFTAPYVTAAYMAPEQSGRTGRSADLRSDLYALGAVYYHLLAGKPPFIGESLSDLIHSHLVREPQALSERIPIHATISRMVSRLLAKEPERRYQTASGLRRDLEVCLEQLEQSGHIQLFELGRYDRATGLEVPNHLYGRSAEVRQLLEALENAASGRAYSLLVTGASGVGKTSLVQELKRPLRRSHGYFCTGKCDALRVEVPYAPLLEALDGWVRQWLLEPEIRQDRLRKRIIDGTKGHEGLIVGLIPSFRHVLGDVPPPPPVPPADARTRLYRAFQRLLVACAGPDLPVVLFLDDLQWADPATLELIERILPGAGLDHFLFVGAYRNNEVDETHPLALMLGRLRSESVSVRTLSLSPLPHDRVLQMVSETLHRPPREVARLAGICYDRTGGNPFYLRRFLQELFEAGIIRREPAGWNWDGKDLEGMPATENVAELLVHAVGELPITSRRIISVAACMGGRFELLVLARVAGLPEKEVYEALQPAISARLVIRVLTSRKDVSDDRSYRFVHDRVCQVAQSLLEHDEQQHIHRRIGEELLEITPVERRGECIFDITGHLNRAVNLIERYEERLRLIRLNLEAGRRAMEVAAHTSAYDVLRLGYRLVNETCWTRDYEAAFDLTLTLARAALLCADLPAARRWIEEAEVKSRSDYDQAGALEVRVDAFYFESAEEAVRTALQALHLFGESLPGHPDSNDLSAAYRNLMARIEGWTDERLVDLPRMTDARAIHVMRLMTLTMAPAYNARPALVPLLAFRQVELTLAHGIAPETAFAYASCGMALCGMFEDMDLGYRFGMLALHALERVPESRYQARVVHLVNAMIRHWKEPVRRSIDPMMDAYRMSLDAGDNMWAAIPLHVHDVFVFLSGGRLAKLESAMTESTHFFRRQHIETFLGYESIVHQAVLNLMGLGLAGETELVGTAYDETSDDALHFRPPDQTTAFIFHFVKAQLGYLFGDNARALAHWDEAERLIDSVMALPYVPATAFFRALTRLELYEGAPPDERARLLAAFRADAARIARWNELAPANHSHRHLLLTAELMRVDGDVRDPFSVYEAAIEAARQVAIVHEEALIRERFGACLMRQGRNELARYYLHSAVDTWRRWGAEARAHHLEQIYFAVEPETPGVGAVTADTIDVPALLKALRVIEEEIDETALLGKVLEIMLQNAGAQRGCMVVSRRGVLHLAVLGTVDPDRITPLADLPALESAEGAKLLCLELVRYVARTQEALLVDDLQNDIRFSASTYVEEVQPRSVLCTPLVHHERLLGILYLENRRARFAFTRANQRFIEAIGTQAAVTWGTLRQLKARQHYLERVVRARTRTLRRQKRALENTNERLEGTNEQLRRAVQKNEEFLGIVAHDLRNPLASIIGFGELIQESIDGDEMQEMLGYLLTSANHMRTIISELLETQVLEQQIHAGRREWTCLSTVIESVVHLSAAQAQKKSIVVHSETTPDVSARVDPAQIQRVVDNLISNAIKFSPHGRTVWVKLGATATEIRISVDDEGPGLTAEDLDKVFTKLQRLSAQPTGGESSVGLGLYIARQIVEQHGGQILAENSPRGGASFSIVLPRTPNEDTSGQANL